jgi:hypothetical protein
MKTNTITDRIKDILEEYNIPADFAKSQSYLGAKEAAIEIMKRSGMPKRFYLAAMYGTSGTIEAENIYLCDTWNFCEMWNGYALDYSIELAKQYEAGNERCEVGLKYPSFDKDAFIKKYKLSYTGYFEPLWSREKKPIDKTFYEIWENKKSGFIFSFESGRMGEGGYAGAIFNSFGDAVTFCEEFLSTKWNYVKDVDLFFNRLGGVNIDDYKLFIEEQKITTPA